MSRFIDGDPSFLQGRKPMIRRRFVTNAQPYPLLHIQSGLIAQQIRHRQSPVMLKNNIDLRWLGTHVVVMPGVTLGKGMAAGSNAVIAKTFNAYNVVAGIQAKSIKDGV